VRRCATLEGGSCQATQTPSATADDGGVSSHPESSTASRNGSAPSVPAGGSGRRSSVARKVAAEEEAANAMRAGLSDARRAARVWKAVAKGYRDRAAHAFQEQRRYHRELVELRSQPQPSDKRRDEQSEAEQLVGAGDGPKHRDGR
jgi:hypothetical protein